MSPITAKTLNAIAELTGPDGWCHATDKELGRHIGLNTEHKPRSVQRAINQLATGKLISKRHDTSTGARKLRVRKPPELTTPEPVKVRG